MKKVFVGFGLFLAFCFQQGFSTNYLCYNQFKVASIQKQKFSELVENPYFVAGYRNAINDACEVCIISSIRLYGNVKQCKKLMGSACMDFSKYTNEYFTQQKDIIKNPKSSYEKISSEWKDLGRAIHEV